MALPTFIVIGAQKAGTTSLYEYLRHHPDIFLPDVKETNFFVGSRTWKEGLDWYTSLFDRGIDHRHRGEMSPSYSFFPLIHGVAERMLAVVPEVRIVYLVRQPIERMQSSWVQAFSDGIELRPIENAVLVNSRYVLGSSYALQLEQYLRYVGRDRVLVVRSEDLHSDRGAALDSVLDFLGLPTGWRPPNLDERHNESAAKRVPTWLGRRVDRQLRNRTIRRRGWAQELMDHSPMSRPLGRRESELSDDLRRHLLRWLQPDLERFARLAPEIGTWGLLEGDPAGPAAHTRYDSRGATEEETP
jgi:hypothetical protein